MQPKNSLKASAVKPAQAKISITSISGEGLSLKLNNKSVFKFSTSPTGNCQICSLSILEGELFLKFMEEKKRDNSLEKYFIYLKDCLLNSKCITIWTFRTKYFPEEYLNILKGENSSNFYFKEEYFINREKFTKLFIKNYS